MIPDETTWECEKCGAYNIMNGIISEGHMYCKDCWDRINRGD